MSVQEKFVLVKENIVSVQENFMLVQEKFMLVYKSNEFISIFYQSVALRLPTTVSCQTQSRLGNRVFSILEKTKIGK
jgi:hypothetical protein